MKPEGSRNMLTPKLRFPEFRKTRGWESGPIGDHVDLLSGHPFDGADLSEDTTGTPILRGVNITEGCVRHSSEMDRYYLGDTAPLEKFRLCADDLVIGMDGSKVGKNSALITREDAGALLIQRVARLRAHNPASIRFIFLYINSPWFHRYVDRINTSSGIPHISAKQIQEFFIAFPSRVEQQKIADCLTSLDELIAAQARKLAALVAHKKGLMQQLFPREGETVPRLRLTRFENDKEWRYEKVIDIAKVTTGEKDTQDKVDDGEFPFVVRSQTLQRINSYAMDTEAVLTSGDGVGVGDDYHYMNGKFDFHQRVYCIYDFRKNVWGRFFYVYFCEHFRTRVGRMSAKNSVDSVRRSMITEMPVALPEFEEQKAISDCILALDDKITAETEKLTALRTHKTGLMQQLFPSAEED